VSSRAGVNGVIFLDEGASIMSNRRTPKLRVIWTAAAALATLVLAAPTMAKGRPESKTPENASKLTTGGEKGEKGQKHKKHRHTKKVSHRQDSKSHNGKGGAAKA